MTKEFMVAFQTNDVSLNREKVKEVIEQTIKDCFNTVVIWENEF